MGVARAFKIDPIIVLRKAGLLPPAGSDDKETLEQLQGIFAKMSRPERRKGLRVLQALIEENYEGGDLSVVPPAPPPKHPA